MKLIELLRGEVEVAYHDPWVPQLDEDGVTLGPSRSSRRRTTPSSSSPRTRGSTTPGSSTTLALIVDLRNATVEPALRGDKVWKL